MRTLLLAALLAAPSFCQSPLGTPFNANNGGGAGWQIFFDLNVLHPAGLTITAMDVNCGTSAVGTPGTIEVWTGPQTHVGNETSPVGWSLAVSGAVTAQGNNVPSPTCLGAGLFLAPGPHAIMVRHLGVSLRYTNGTGTNQTASTAEVTLTAGSVTSAFFSGSFFTPRVWNGNLYYNVGNVPGSGCAQSAPFGAGCYAGATSFYEVFASLAAFDLAGTAATPQVVAGAPIPQGYVVTQGAPAWFQTTSPAVLSNATVPAAMGDNSYSQALALPFAFAYPGGSTTVIHASANGYVNLFATTAITSDATPTPAELFSQPARFCPLWCDLHPTLNLATNANSGVHFDVDPSNQAVYVTWLGVADRSGTVLPVAGATSVDVQLALFASGAFEFRYRGIVPNTTTGAVLVGWSRGTTGTPAPYDPGPVDLSASLPLLTTGPDSRPLVHTVGLPRVGTTTTLAVADVENLVPLAVLFFGDTAVVPGLDLSFLGAPGCLGHTNANLASVTVPVSLPAGTGSVPLAIPANPALVGLAIASQAAAFTSRNALGLATSNGVLWTVGN
jgi:hypothetical protein